MTRKMKKNQFIRQATRANPEDRWDGFEDKVSYTTAEIVKAVKIHIATEMAMSTMLSRPIPLSIEGKMHLSFFLFNITGPYRERCLRAPFCRALSPMDTYLKVQFEMAEPPSFNIIVSPRASLGDPEVICWHKSFKGAPPTGENITIWREQLLDIVDELLKVYPRDPEQLTDNEKELVKTYIELFGSLIEQPLLPAYRSLNPHFFDWLESVIGEKVDPLLTI
jgi:hypothetical protein